MSNDKHMFDDRPLTKERISEMRARAENLLLDIEAHPESYVPNHPLYKSASPKDGLESKAVPARKARTFSQARQGAAQGHIGA